MGWRRVWRDIRLRRPAFDLVADPAAPLRYRGRPFSVSRLPVAPELRGQVEVWAADGDAARGALLADELAEAMRAPVVFDGRISRPAD